MLDESKRIVLVCKIQSHLTLGIIVIVAIGHGFVSVKFMIGIDMKSNIVKYRFGALISLA